MRKLTNKARVLAARPGAVCDRVTDSRHTFYRVTHNGMVIGQASVPANAWLVARRAVERIERIPAPVARRAVNPYREMLALAVLVPLTMALTFSLLANVGLVTSDPAGKHPVNAAEMWGIR